MGVKGSGRKPQTNDWFIEKVIEKHGHDKFGFDKCDYKGNRYNVTLFCFECQDYFTTRGMFILRGTGCSICRRKRTAKSKTLTTADFIDRATLVHGDKYNYSLVDYKKTSIPVSIICQDHGEFLQQPSNHLQGQGCPHCNHWEILVDKRPDDPAMLYHVKFTNNADGSVFHKVGITIKDWRYRLHGVGVLGYSVELIDSFYGPCVDCHDLEVEILDMLYANNARYKCHVLKDTRIGGWTETYYPDGVLELQVSEMINR